MYAKASCRPCILDRVELPIEGRFADPSTVISPPGGTVPNMAVFGTDFHEAGKTSRFTWWQLADRARLREADLAEVNRCRRDRNRLGQRIVSAKVQSWSRGEVNIRLYRSGILPAGLYACRKDG